jgi:nitrogenase molybdenum-iron protein alpha/beta subunit
MARRPGLATRERRLQAIGAFLDAPSVLAAEFAGGDPVQRIRTFSQATPDDLVAALDLLGRVAGAGIVVHGPRGCAAVLATLAPTGAWAVTGLDQRDTIMGSEGAVSRAVLALHRRHRPWVIFVVATPAVAINSDDAGTTADALSEELGIPVRVVRTDGFRSRIAATGFDTACQALLSLVPEGAGTREEWVNLLARDPAMADEAATLLARLGLELNVLPAGAGAGSFERAGRARLSLCLDPEATASLGLGLEATHGVKLLRGGVPFGLAATRRWLASVAAATGRPEPTGGEGPDAGALSGVRVHLALPPDAAFPACALVGELGGTVAGLTVDHVDRTHAEALADFARAHPGIVLHVAAGQPFETVNLLASERPDLFVGTPDLAALAAAAGIPSVGLTPAGLAGVRGAERLARRSRKALANPAFVRRLGALPVPYASGWLRRSADWHIKQEVR